MAIEGQKVINTDCIIQLAWSILVVQLLLRYLCGFWFKAPRAKLSHFFWILKELHYPKPMSWYYFLFFQRYFQYDRATVILGSLVATRISYNVYSWLYHHDVPATIRTRESFFAFVKSIPILKDKIKALVDENKVMVSPTYTSINPYRGQFRTPGQSPRSKRTNLVKLEKTVWKRIWWLKIRLWNP